MSGNLVARDQWAGQNDFGDEIDDKRHYNESYGRQPVDDIHDPSTLAAIWSPVGFKGPGNDTRREYIIHSQTIMLREHIDDIILDHMDHWDQSHLWPWRGCRRPPL